jgi:ubiquinone/menaquinone biosynthesis C-methylase UbiE
MKNRDTGVKSYFENYANNFISYYKSGKIPVISALKRYLWADIHERERLTVEICKPIEGKTVIDVGCGDGRYTFKFIEAGAGKVVGIDLSREMIKLAELNVQSVIGKNKCEFICDNFSTKQFQEACDYTIAMGVMDYVADAVVFLNKMISISREKVVVSFPKKTITRGSIRRLKYYLRDCPLFLFSKDDIIGLISRLNGVNDYTITAIPGIGMDFVVEIVTGTKHN